MLPRLMLGSTDSYYMDHQHLMMPNAFLHNSMQSQLTQYSTNEHRNHGTNALSMITITPDAVIANERIESGCPGMLPSTRRRRSDSGSLTRLSHAMSTGSLEAQAVGPTPRNPPVDFCWETMTDEEREEHQRMRRKQEAYKTALCDAFKKSGSCSYGEACRFAHGEAQLRLPAQPRGKAHPKYKTQLCDKFSANGHCPYGPRCQFIHKMKKGLSMFEYESLLHDGQISPASPEEVFTGEFHPTARKGIRRESFKKKLAYDGSGSHSVRSPSGGSNQRGLVYPKMQVINIEQALLAVDGSDEKENMAHERYCEKDRVPVKPVPLNQLFTTKQSAPILPTALHNSMEDLHLDTADFETRFPRLNDLSAIREESEENASFNAMSNLSVQPRGVKDMQSNIWCSNALLGRQMDTIAEDEKENMTAETSAQFYFGDGSARSSADLYVESYDEESLAKELYGQRYSPSPMEMPKQWQN